ncbi:MAG TPA: cell division protein FtsZ, partial [Solirubrobacteraceae bacterium]
MREGPLAALFRKTAQDVDEASESPGERAPERGEERPAPSAPEQSARYEPVASPGPPVESTEPRYAAEPEVEEPRIPLPHERLRHAFSADIPENVLERPAADQRPAPEKDVYADALGAGDVAGAPNRRLGPVLRVVGVGGAGVNAINRMVEAEIEGVEFLAINTDLQSLQQSAAHETLHIGDSITHGLGSGSNPELGRAAARE